MCLQLEWRNDYPVKSGVYRTRLKISLSYNTDDLGFYSYFNADYKRWGVSCLTVEHAFMQKLSVNDIEIEQEKAWRNL